MTGESKAEIIKNSLVFHVMLEALPLSEYQVEDFKRDEPLIVRHIKEKLDAIDLSVYELALITKAENQNIPSILLSESFKRIIKKEYGSHFRKGLTEKLRNQVLQRDNYKCQYCGADLRESINNPFPPTVDHVIPMRAGGKNELANLVACCWQCNIGKKDYGEFKYEGEE